MTAKTTTERQREFRAGLKRQGMAEVRGIYAPPELHEAIKEAAKQILGENCNGTSKKHA